MGTFLKNFIKELSIPLLVGIISSIVSGLGVHYLGKKEKKSLAAISRKQDLYLPMIDELDAISNKELNVFEQIRLPFIQNVREKNHEYCVNGKIIKKLQTLNNLIKSYNEINVSRIAHGILVSHFQNCYESLYGTVIDGYSHHVDQFGNEYYEEEEVEEFRFIKGYDFQREIKSLILHENMFDHLIPSKDGDYDKDTYSDLVRIYELSINVSINGQPIPKRETPPNWSGTTAEYFAYHCDFFEKYNNHSDVIKKLELRDKIIKLAQGIAQDLKKMVKDIVYKYEKEEV